MTVKFSQVSYVYQKGTPFEHVALRDIETTFQQGKYYAVIGQTGSGKSTLIQHFNGLLKPSTGKLQIDDITITHKTKDKVLKQIRKRIGVVFQFPESQLFEDSVEREILFGPKNFNMPIDEVKARAYKLLIDFGFSRDILQQSPFQMSGGQMRKIAITSILAMDPDIVILDEPTAGLDPKSRDQIMKMIKKLQVEQNKTIILVTHEMNDVAKYVDEIKIMKQGQLVEECSPRKLFSDTNYVNQLHLDVPDVVKLQRDIEDKYQYYFNKIALTEDEFIDMYKEWQEDER
ncbi:energy-coupling factor transporter ATPase [Staphylococcus saprophyticus]|uniref:Energy-coupling factor transporter ATP-binding protein EcfA2 n=1 Tax=Staphylococcus saprophyticus subsp. saprophyticus (strain ATCC 15305 / DSM 20229 / NCIMB 8711 / NCTC 7292 / S-41) TaxID=342451 RepID=ECFA2_STAS1|nr:MULTISPECIES: energy-coupling factor transporter ATPase [Staphylococcus]Q49ZD9.1 RecName: Full=Energy-coupling factor transporter ATP-binding protein EcfA2; Short=ECF transporter A component EcfA2 [Staphylococcus saprophyticus subsp. saprophyticus ATCC 15305 = NCTC 7292]CRV28684.1 cobalt import ATP-binding protein CbiO 1 [Streptococcus equi subsp. equi]AMG19763.1 energy-coupling factor transporter ATPase [Staphylococcus saprophyticus]AMG32867.1 energy-coupling factor transporter ATPase [Stap